jgi:hypothetical protein
LILKPVHKEGYSSKIEAGFYLRLGSIYARTREVSRRPLAPLVEYAVILSQEP